MQRGLRDGDDGEGQLLEKRVVVVVVVPVREEEDATAEAGDDEGGGEAMCRWRQMQREEPPAQLFFVEVELELLEAVEGGGLEPAVQERGGGVAVAAGEAAAGARVRGEDEGDGESPSRPEVLEVERRRAPERAPSLVGRRETMSPRMPSGRRLIRSSIRRSCSSFSCFS